jgi:hypothetical protein
VKFERKGFDKNLVFYFLRKDFNMKSINFKLLTENDLPLLHSWFHKPHIQQWYARGENYTLDMIKEKYMPRILNSESIPNFIVYANITPIGYIQLYCVNAPLKHQAIAICKTIT